MGLNEVQHGAVQFGVGADNTAVFEITIAPFKVAYEATGFLDQKDAGRHIPLIETDFPETIHAACSDVGKIQRRRSRAANAGGILQKALKHAKIGIQIALVLERNPRAEEGAGEAFLGSNPNSPIIEGGASAANGGKELLFDGVINHTALHFPAMKQRDGHRKLRKTVEEVSRSIQWINDPDKVARFGALKTMLLAQDRMDRPFEEYR